MKTSIYPGEAFFAPQGDVEKARIQDMAELKPKIQALYDAGAPLFPRHLIQDIRDQLRRLNGTCGKVIVRGFDGNDVELDVETGHTIPFGPEKEFVMYVSPLFLLLQTLVLIYVQRRSLHPL